MLRTPTGKIYKLDKSLNKAGLPLLARIHGAKDGLTQIANPRSSFEQRAINENRPVTFLSNRTLDYLKNHGMSGSDLESNFTVGTTAIVSFEACNLHASAFNIPISISIAISRINESTHRLLNSKTVSGKNGYHLNPFYFPFDINNLVTPELLLNGFKKITPDLTKELKLSSTQSIHEFLSDAASSNTSYHAVKKVLYNALVNENGAIFGAYVESQNFCIRHAIEFLIEKSKSANDIRSQIDITSSIDALKKRDRNYEELIYTTLGTEGLLYIANRYRKTATSLIEEIKKYNYIQSNND